MAFPPYWTDYYASYTSENRHMAKPALYLELYGQYLKPYFDQEAVLLELGIFEGHSLELFAQMLAKSLIIGVDKNVCKRQYSTDRIIAYQGSQDDPRLFQRIMLDNRLEQFDVIIDDCSHIGGLTLASFNILISHLRPGGIYVIEDWGTGYWPKYPGGRLFNAVDHLKARRWLPAWVDKMVDKFPTKVKLWGERFKSHQYGVPGVIKQLVDEVGMETATRNTGLGTQVRPKIEFLHIYPGLSIMRKSVDA